MKKSDIINTYNSLLPELKKQVERYSTITGENYTTRGFSLDVMSPHHMNYTKDDLERKLLNRERLIRKVIDDTQNYINTQDMKSTESGRLFIQSMEDRKKELTDRLSEISRQFVTSFNELLNRIGMPDWKLFYENPIPGYSTIYIDIFQSTTRAARLRCSIFFKDGQFHMDLSSSMCGSKEITCKEHFQYQQFKAYVNIFDHCEIVNKWLNTTYKELAKEVSGINSVLNELNDNLENPYDAWMKSK